MASNFEFSDLITREFAYEWRNQLSYAATATHKYENMWAKGVTYNPGSTVRVRLPNNVLVEEGEVVTGTDLIEHTVDLTLGNRINATLNYNITDLSTEMGMENFRENVIIPSISAVVNKLNVRISDLAKTQLNLFTGDSTADLTTFGAFNNINAVLDENSVDRAIPRYAALSVRQATQLQNNLQNSFNTILNKDITQDATLGRLAKLLMILPQIVQVLL
jgi:hypothetical protein